MFYVIATDRKASEMRPGGIVYTKHVILCKNQGSAMSIVKMLKERKERFNAVQMTQTVPELNPKIYRPVPSEASAWLQGR
jgi:hypothetical protein